jgi:hypothetical protein
MKPPSSLRSLLHGPTGMSGRFGRHSQTRRRLLMSGLTPEGALSAFGTAGRR